MPPALIVVSLSRVRLPRSKSPFASSSFAGDTRSIRAALGPGLVMTSSKSPLDDAKRLLTVNAGVEVLVVPFGVASKECVAPATELVIAVAAIAPVVAASIFNVFLFAKSVICSPA